jgi:hypothetical protein
MKALIAIALLATSAPVFAASAAGGNDADRRICTRVELQSGSRMSYRRICKTPSEWRQQLGADWRQHLTGRRSIEEDMQTLDAQSHPFAPADFRQGGSVRGQGGQGPSPSPQ